MCEVSGHKIICGLPRDHKCNSDGPGALILDAHPYLVPATKENHVKYYEQSSGASVTCSICGRAAYSNLFWGG